MNAPAVVILAGGQSRRMEGKAKPLLPLQNRPLIQHVIDRMAPQAGAIAINAPLGSLPDFGLTMLPDTIPDQPGPLAGILAAMLWVKDRTPQNGALDGSSFVITVPADAPFLPGDLIPRLILTHDEAPDYPVIAASGMRRHPVCGLWPIALAETLHMEITKGTRRVLDWTTQTCARIADFPETVPDSFFNINTPADLTMAEHLLDAP